MSLKTLAGAMPFAHLLSAGKRAARAENDEDERKQRDGESDDDFAKRMKDLDDEEEARRAEEEEKENARRAQEEKDKEDARNAGADGDDDGDDETDDAKKAARLAERTRCARIVAHGVITGNVHQAAVFAFDTKMSSKAAIAALSAAVPPPAAPRIGLGDRMARVQTPVPGASGAPGAPSLAAQIVAAGKKRRGEQ